MGSIGTIAGIGAQASSISSLMGEVAGEDGANGTLSRREWTDWQCNQTMQTWVREDGVTTVEEWIATSLNTTSLPQGQGATNNHSSGGITQLSVTLLTDPTIPPPQHVLQQTNDIWRIKVFHRRVVIAFGLSVLLMLLAIVSGYLYESMMSTLWRAEESTRVAEEAAGEKTYSWAMREWEAARRRSHSLSRAPRR
jgi:hypothetical protein